MNNYKLTPKRIEINTIMNFDSLLDVLRYYPYRHEILETTKLDFSLHDKKVCVEGKIISPIKVDYLSNKRIKTSFSIMYENKPLKLIMFNRFAYSKILTLNTNVVCTGKYNSFNNEVSVNTFFIGSLEGKCKIIPQYSLPSSIKELTYKKYIEYAYDNSRYQLVDIIPNYLIKKYRLVNLKDAIKYLHFANTKEELHQAYRYLKYEEFLTFCLQGLVKRNMFSLKDGFKDKEYDILTVNSFINSLPFKLTNDQNIACKEILDDINRQSCMSRLLQGDVGSGKTIVALISLIANYTCNYQGALMAPTDILARQHYQTIKEFLDRFDKSIRVELLISSLPSSKKKEVLAKLANNEIDIIVGTHALIQDQVVYNKLGLAIVDEQHRFGVKQRAMLKDKGNKIDTLYMSATPIPRTLASTIYMDMDVSSIQAYPYKERKIITKFINKNSLKDVDKEIKEYLKTNQKIYVVCPCINESTLELKNVIKTYEALNKHYGNASLLHGKMTSEEKDRIMNDFKEGKTKILVSTTVIEVGINIMDANMMVIYNAERFGLAQIHQLRGRIARDGKVGYCYLLSDAKDDMVKDRLNFITTTNDGFEISEYDLKLRGAGDMLGLAQSGKSPFVIANLIEDFNILKEASKDAREIFDNPRIENKIIIDKVEALVKNSDKYID